MWSVQFLHLLVLFFVLIQEMFDMPMIKIHSSDDSNNRPSSLSSDKSENNDQEDNIKSENEDVFGPEVSGYSTSSSDDLKECPSDKSTLLEIPEQKVSNPDWSIKCTKESIFTASYQVLFKR